MQQAKLQVQQAMLQVQQAMLREINNKAKLSPAELELGLSLAIGNNLSTIIFELVYSTIVDIGFANHSKSNIYIKCWC